MEHAVSRNLIPAPGVQLGLTSVGRSDTMPGHRFGPAVRPYYLIHYILAGQGRFRAGGVTYQLHTGQGFLISPNQQTDYQADEIAPWSYVWLGFTGPAAADLVARLPFANRAHPTFSARPAGALATCVNRILALPATLAGELEGLSQLFRFLILLSSASPLPRPTQRATNPYVERALEHLRLHPATISATQLAAVVGLDRSYFSALFKEATGMASEAYLRTFRLTRARHLLESTRLSVEQVARECGYRQANSLARSFRRTYGLSPTAFRRQVAR